MLIGLSIRDVVLIDRLDLSFRPGLCVLTGETGAGKSILLDALGLALGVRAESGLVRRGAEQATVSAEFTLPAKHPARALLQDSGVTVDDDTLVLRRMVSGDGRSRAFIADQPVSVALLRQVGEALVEIEGQFAQRGLLDPATHRDALDAYGVAEGDSRTLADAWQAWRAAVTDHETAAQRLQAAQAEEAFLRHAMTELDALDPKSGEETSLADERALMQNRERLTEALESALAELAGERGGERALQAALRQVARVKDKAAGRLDTAAAALERAAVEAREAVTALEDQVRTLGGDTNRLEQIEERLFALRALARKHNVAVDGLAGLRAEIGAKLNALEAGGDGVEALKHAVDAARGAYVKAADKVSAARRTAAAKLDPAVMKELKPLKLEKARFTTVLTALIETEWGPHGRERVHFEVATNPGAPAGPLAKVASGGELSRFMLALKVVLARTSPVPTLVFDEVDSGIGGAVAAAVGDRLHRLGQELQVLVVTHSPQVAARGAHHWRVEKSQAAQKTSTRVEELSTDARREEIARMLSGASITAEARAAAASLMAGAPA
ncbi:MAG TPA: DNA repair protein RecN [Stellaceae bacterium]|nr:DNA repair protein RecN [Stellaceae bacterium]